MVNYYECPTKSTRRGKEAISYVDELVTWWTAYPVLQPKLKKRKREMASTRKNPQDVFEALIDALYDANDAKQDEGRSFDEDILDLEDAFNRVMERL